MAAGGGPGADDDRAPAFDRLIAGLAIAGGVLMLAVGFLVCASVIGRWASGHAFGQRLGLGPIPGDFEFAQMGTAIAVFLFLPICQLRRGNIVVDTFTARWPARVTRRIDAAWDFLYAACAGVLVYCLFNGAQDAVRSKTVTMVVGAPIWPAFALATCLMAVLAGVAAVAGWRMARRGA